MSAAELENAAGSRLERFETYGAVAGRLGELGNGATAIVVDEFHGPSDENGVGAHAYVITNENGRMVVLDKALGSGPLRFPPDGTNVASTHAIIFKPDGTPARLVDADNPVTSARAHDPGPESRIGQPDHQPVGGHAPHSSSSPEAPVRPKLPVMDRPYYANPHFVDRSATQEYVAKHPIR
ncbi:hypothetical protein ACTWPB_04285 [Nocardia sp. IBHARD005]|uniref:hypothetical protein n=1 Tax=Nocardia sp. IBHARD005 TaxID=3457765 RepID=UPI00405A1C03